MLIRCCVCIRAITIPSQTGKEAGARLNIRHLIYRFLGLREETISICNDPEDLERDDALSNLQQFSHFDDRAVQFVEVIYLLIPSVNFITSFVNSKNYFYWSCHYQLTSYVRRV